MFVLQIAFPGGRYFAATSEGSPTPEWPPHPSRVFSALVAAAYRSGAGMSTQRRQALLWLEAQGAPGLQTPAQVSTADAPQTYVPPADWVKTKGAGAGVQLEHPVLRWRQAHYFSQVALVGEPVVHLYWQANPPPDLRQVLDDIAAGVTHVGTSHSMALVCVLDHVPPVAGSTHYHPDPAGPVQLRVCLPGRLAELDQLFERTAPRVRRPLPASEGWHSYRQRGQLAVAPSAFEMIALRYAGPRYELTQAQALARCLRKALMSQLGDAAPPALHGHCDLPHLCWLPLADVGHRHASGMILGIGMGLPVSLSGAERQQILAGLASLSQIVLPDGRIGQLQLDPPRTTPRALQAATWFAAARDWATVTPVILDRPPRRADAPAWQAAIAQSLQLAGLPTPEQIEVSTYSEFAGAPSALAFASKVPRFHARIRFAAAVQGPVLAGRGRHFGVGVFRPLAAAHGG